MVHIEKLRLKQLIQAHQLVLMSEVRTRDFGLVQSTFYSVGLMWLLKTLGIAANRVGTNSTSDTADCKAAIFCLGLQNYLLIKHQSTNALSSVKTLTTILTLPSFIKSFTCQMFIKYPTNNLPGNVLGFIGGEG